jgi:hypothetical protein
MQEEFSINESLETQQGHNFLCTSGEYYVIDDNNSSYGSTNIISFSSEQISNALRYADYRQSYISVPFIQRTTVRDVNGNIIPAANRGTYPKFNCYDPSGLNNPHSLKNSVFSTVSYCSVELNNYQISQSSSATSGPQCLFNIEKNANNEFVNKNLNSLLYYPDDNSSQKYVKQAFSIGVGQGDCASNVSELPANIKMRQNTLQKLANKSRTERIKQIPVILIGSQTQDVAKSEFQTLHDVALGDCVASLEEVYSSYTEISDYTITTKWYLKLPLRFLSSIFESLPLVQRLGLKMQIQLHHRSSTLVSYDEDGIVINYSANALTNCIPFQISSPVIIDSLTADIPADSIDKNVFVMRYNGNVAAGTASSFSLFTTFDISTSAQPFLDSTMTVLTKNHWESRCRLHVYLMTLTEQIRQIYESDPMKDVKFMSVYSEKSSQIISPKSSGSNMQTISVSNIGFSFLRYALVFFYGVAESKSTPDNPLATDACQGIHSELSHFSNAPMSSSRCTISSIQATLSSKNLYSQVENSQHINYKVLNSNSFQSGMEINTASGQISEYAFNNCPVLLLDLSKHEKSMDAITRTLQIRVKNLSNVYLQPVFYIFYDEALSVNVASGEIQQKKVDDL